MLESTYIGSSIANSCALPLHQTTLVPSFEIGLAILIKAYAATCVASETPAGPSSMQDPAFTIAGLNVVHKIVDPLSHPAGLNGRRSHVLLSKHDPRRKGTLSIRKAVLHTVLLVFA